MPEDGCNYKRVSFLIWFVYLVLYLPTRYSGASSTQSWFPGQVPNTKAFPLKFQYSWNLYPEQWYRKMPKIWIRINYVFIYKVLNAVSLLSVGVWLESKDQFLDTSRKARNWKDSQRETIAKLFSFYYQS